MSLKWYVASTRPLAEYTAASTLKHSGFQVFAPCALILSPQAGRLDTPLFPGYLFLRCNLKEDWTSVRKMPQIRGLVRFEGQPSPVPDEVIAELAQRVNAINETGGLRTHYRPGDSVRVMFGATEALARVIEETKSPQAQVRVLMEFLGGVVRAQVPWQNLRLADSFTLHERKGAPRRTRGGGRWLRGFAPDSMATASRGRHVPYNERLSL